MSALIPIEKRGVVRFAPKQYGTSVRGLPLEVWLPSSGETELLIFAAIHGEEPETTALLSKALRSFENPPIRTAVVLSANPDGVLLGTRGNACGVELNRNFPAQNWQAAPVKTRWSPAGEPVEFSTGPKPGSEPETQGLINLMHRLRPRMTISLHAPLGCIDDPLNSPLGQWCSDRSGLGLVQDIGYPTPGSFGSWCAENHFPVITYEFPGDSVSRLQATHLPILTDLLQHGMAVLDQ